MMSQRAELPVQDDVTIVVVDDNEQLLQIMRRLFVLNGFSVVAKNSGDAALESLLIGRAPDVLVTDAVMPGDIQGWDLAKYSKSLYPMTPVLMISGHIGEEHPSVASISEIDAFLAKPFALGVLLEYTRRLLDLSTARRRKALG